MPSASDELQNKMIARFGDIMDHGPIDFLQSRGYVLLRSYDWTKKNATWSDISKEEKECIAFLFEEWDFGGFLTTEQAKEVSKNG